ncbi:hypothetical protein BJ742DRAFT_819661 [Cladochytrium replicatum]|nr:hypothetical protein BJ742DRAFT_819661 [Cladochytrium replicatum]
MKDVQLNQPYTVSLGTSFTNPKSASFHTVKPAGNGPALLQPSTVSQQEGSAYNIEQESGEVFVSRQKAYSEDECVLIYNPATQSFTLERLNSNLQLHKPRKAAAPPRPNPAPAPPLALPVPFKAPSPPPAPIIIHAPPATQRKAPITSPTDLDLDEMMEDVLNDAEDSAPASTNQVTAALQKASISECPLPGPISLNSDPYEVDRELALLEEEEAVVEKAPISLTGGDSSDLDEIVEAAMEEDSDSDVVMEDAPPNPKSPIGPISLSRLAGSKLSF